MLADSGGVSARDQQRQVGRVVATVTGEIVSAQTVSKLTRYLDEAVRQFHQAQIGRRQGVFVLGWGEPTGAAAQRAQAVQMLVAYGVKSGTADGNC